MADHHIHNLLFAIGVVFASVLMLADRPAHAQAVMQSDLNRCMAVPDRSDRLLCFESLATQYGASSAASTVMAEPEDVTRKTENTTIRQPAETLPVTPPATTPEHRGVARTSSAITQPDDDFGLPKRPVAEERDNKTRELVLASAKRDQRGNIVFTMQDGQVWRQTDKAPIIMPSYGDQAVIEKGFPAGFRMRLNKRTIRVERLK